MLVVALLVSWRTLLADHFMSHLAIHPPSCEFVELTHAVTLGEGHHTFTCPQSRVLEKSRKIADVKQTGKSSLAVQFVEDHFVESYYPTIENTFSKIIKYKGQDFSTEIIDTAGQVS